VREALNNNPVVQIAVIGVLVVVVGLFFMMNMKKGGSSSSSSSSSATAGATSSPSTGGTTAPVTSGASSATPAAPPSSSAGSVSVTGGTVTPAALVPGPGLPAPVIAAWKRGDAIALLIVRGGGIDDRLVRGSVEGLKRDSGIAVFVTRAKSVARYSRITQGVGVDRAPALVIVRPHKESGSVPEATVRYGFRSSASVLQAVHDALYNGPDDLPYSPR
jgi:hypothetical protein